MAIDSTGPLTVTVTCSGGTVGVAGAAGATGATGATGAAGAAGATGAEGVRIGAPDELPPTPLLLELPANDEEPVVTAGVPL